MRILVKRRGMRGGREGCTVEGVTEERNEAQGRVWTRKEMEKEDLRWSFAVHISAAHAQGRRGMESPRGGRRGRRMVVGGLYTLFPSLLRLQTFSRHVP
ncbi:hypothetical protein MRB53_037540 [Persea americana]|nr:hypothetical protein MRB53_037540 [Persea americana]